jgi:hypothetical protein
MHLICSPVGVRSRTSAPGPCFHEEPSKKRVQCGPVKNGALSSGSLSFGPPGWHGGGVQFTTKSASTWLFTARHGINSSSNSANYATHLPMFPIALGLWSMALSGCEDITKIM